MAIYNQVRWVGVKPTVKTAQTPAKKVSIGTSSTEILAANDNRTSFLIRNTGSVPVYIRLGTGATVDDMLLEEGDILFCDDYTGTVEGIVASGTGEVRVIEV